MLSLKKNILKILQFLIYLFPVSFILGNFIINLFVFLITLLGIFYYKENLFKWFDKKFLKFLSFFFLIILISSYYNHFLVQENKDVIKSILYLRYFFLVLVIRTLVVNSEINLNTFLKFCLLISFLISFDIIFQFFFGKNLLGYEAVKISDTIKYFTGVFKDELSPGGFILMFSTLGVFSLFEIIKIKKRKYIYLIIFAFLVIFFLISLILAGGRMPVILFLLFLIGLALIYKKKEKIYFLFLTTLVICSLSLVIFKSDSLIKRAGSFHAGIPNPMTIYAELKKEHPKLKKYENSGLQFHNIEEVKNKPSYVNLLPHHTGHLTMYITSLDLFFDRPLIGGGIKSFRNFCSTKIHLPNRICQSHPHNYFLEILNDTGIIGFLLFMYIALYLLYNNYVDYNYRSKTLFYSSNWIYLAIILSVFIIFFPIKSTGSFFSTFNSAFIFLILGFSSGLTELKYKMSFK